MAGRAYPQRDSCAGLEAPAVEMGSPAAPRAAYLPVRAVRVKCGQPCRALPHLCHLSAPPPQLPLAPQVCDSELMRGSMTARMDYSATVSTQLRAGIAEQRRRLKELEAEEREAKK